MHPDPKTGAIDRNIGRRIRAKRMELDISVPFMADEIGVSVAVLQEFEAGTLRVSALALWLISGFLRVPVTYFFHGPHYDLSLDQQTEARGSFVRANRNAKTRLSLIHAEIDTAGKPTLPS